MDYRSVLTFIAALMLVAVYIPYITKTWNKTIQPHVYSWLIWTIVTSIAFSLQLDGGGGLGSFVTFTVAFMCLIITLVTAYKTDRTIISPIDTFFLIMALLSIAIWLFVQQPVFSVILISLIDILAFLPTVRKTYHLPFSEPMELYIVTVVAYAISIVALYQYNFVTLLYPMSWILAITLFLPMVYVRRKVFVSEK